MLLRRLDLADFRCYDQLSLAVEPGLSVLVGSNAQGKTAFLEALYVLSAARSFRARSDVELVRWGQGTASVKAELERDSGRTRRLEIRFHREAQKQALLQGRPVERLADFLGEVPVALFTPDDLSLVQGGPGGRRRYLDLQLCKLYPAYLGTLSRYQKALRQRNELLRRRPPPKPLELEPWDSLLAELGTAITARRRQLLEDVGVSLAELYAHLSQEGAALETRYQPGGPDDPPSFLERLLSRRGLELRRGSTLTGPHRDDFELLLGSQELRRYGSQGQQRTAALSLRLAEARVLSERGGERAIVLLDDCFSELDGSRQQRLLTLLEDYPQVLVTSATPLDLRVDAKVMRVEGGAVHPAGESSVTSC